MNTCLTGGRPFRPDDVVSVPVVDVGDVDGVSDAAASVCTAAALLPAAAPAPPPPPPPLPPPPDGAANTVCAAGVAAGWSMPTTISGALASVTTLVPPTSEPAITPNPSMAITATAAARGPGIANPNGGTFGLASANESASGVPGGRSGSAPCS